MNIGITVNLKGSIWSNGINQNAIYVANLIKEIGYTPYLIYQSDLEVESVGDFNIVKFADSYDIKFDIVIQLGISISKAILEKYKNKNNGVKLVSYKCGNEFMIDMESIIFNAYEQRTIGLDGNKVNPPAIPDQLWLIPQMENSCLHYFKFMSKQEKALVVPFVWEPISIDDYCEDFGYSTYTKRDLNRIGVMEPNLSVMKNVLAPIAILEKQYNLHENLQKIYLIGSDVLKSNKRLLQILGETNIHKNKLVTAEPRLPVIQAINKYVDVVLSWQWENNLNYLWLDVAWMGWPVVHNGSLCQDVGYYYPEFDIESGQIQVQKAIKSHNDDNDYLERNRSIIKRYTHKNEQLKADYKMLLDNLVNDKFVEYNYDWKTNSLK
jgi:hypothetical protein